MGHHVKKSHCARVSIGLLLLATAALLSPRFSHALTRFLNTPAILPLHYLGALANLNIPLLTLVPCEIILLTLACALLCSTNAPCRARFAACVNKFPNACALALGLSMAMMLVAIAEFACFLLNEAKVPPPTKQMRVLRDVPIRCTDPDLGHWIKPNTTSRATKMLGNEVVHDAVYSTDALHRRVTPVAHPETRDKAIAFFGCSLTWGEGVNDDQTLPYHVGCLAPEYRPYNYAAGGWGPQHTLVLLNKKDTVANVTPPLAIGVYTFIDHHVLRVIGTSRVASWTGRFPCYELADNGALLHLGTLADNPPEYTLLDHALDRSYIARYFGADNLPSIRNKHLELTAHIIAEAARIFSEHNPDSTFHVLFYPGKSSRYGPRMRALLTTLGVACIGEEELKLDLRTEGDYCYKDFHPKPWAHRRVAERLVDVLQINRNSPPAASLPAS